MPTPIKHWKQTELRKKEMKRKYLKENQWKTKTYFLLILTENSKLWDQFCCRSLHMDALKLLATSRQTNKFLVKQVCKHSEDMGLRKRYPLNVPKCFLVIDFGVGIGNTHTYTHFWIVKKFFINHILELLTRKISPQQNDNIY